MTAYGQNHGNNGDHDLLKAILDEDVTDKLSRSETVFKLYRTYF